MTKAKATSILGAISAIGLINVSLRVSKRIKKKKLGCETDGYSIGTVTGYYQSFLKATLNEMNKYLEIKRHYLVMDNAPIHSSADIGNYIHSKDTGMVTFLRILLNSILLNNFGQLSRLKLNEINSWKKNH